MMPDKNDEISHDLEDSCKHAEERTDMTTPRCGLICWRPDFLQIGYNWKLGLALMCLFSFLRGMTVMGFHSINTSSFEKRFDVESKQIGWFVSASTFALSATTIVASYYGDRTSNKPRMVALAALCHAIGSLLMSLPHFVMPPYSSGHSEKIPAMCYITNGSTNLTTDDPLADDCKHSSSSYFGILIAANVIFGVGTGIFISVGISFVDDFSTIASSSFNVGVTHLSMAIGAAAGFGFGSLLLKVDANFNMKGVPKQNSSDPMFLGAWWLGDTVGIGLYAILAICFFFFDKELPETSKLREEKLAKAQTHVSSIKVDLETAGQNKIIRLFAAFVDHSVRLFTNPVVVLITLAHIIGMLAHGGMQPFLVKLFQTFYGISEMSAGMVMAALTLVGIAGGSILSGIVTRRFEMSVRSMLLMIIIFSSLALALNFMTALICPREKLAGVSYEISTSSYYLSSYKFNASNLESPCNAHCKCRPQIYSPVCNTQTKLEFYSACYAGCSNFGNSGNNTGDIFSFTDCSCLKGVKNSGDSLSTVKYGLCTNDSCTNMYLAIAAFFIMLLCGFFNLVPSTQVLLRTVPLEERSFSLAFNEALQSLLGMTPAPLFMGLIFDQACILRQPSSCRSADVGACAVYNSVTLSWWLIGIMTSFDFLSIICITVAFILYRPPSGETLPEYFRHLAQWWIRKIRRHDENKS